MIHRPSIFTPAPPVIEQQPLELKAPRRRALGSVIGHTGFNVARYHTTHLFGGLLPLLAGMLLFGWRAVLAVLFVVITTLLAGLIWRRIGARGHTLRPARLLWLGLVIALMLPANLLHSSTWPILPAAGLLMVILCWGLTPLGAARFHPAVVVYLALACLYPPRMSQQTLLQRNRLLLGDTLAAPREVEAHSSQQSWRKRALVSGQDALKCTPPSLPLLNFTHAGPAANRDPLESVIRDQVPPLEDLVLGAVPGGIGTTSAVMVIIGGLFLLYRGLIDFRIPLLITLSAWCAMLILPLPDQSQWHWFPGHTRGIGWALGVTLSNYEMLASPLLFTAFFLAGSPSVRPLSKKGRSVYAVAVGLLAAVLQLYFSVTLGSYIALLLVGFTTPMLDNWLMPRPLV